MYFVCSHRYLCNYAENSFSRLIISYCLLSRLTRIKEFLKFIFVCIYCQFGLICDIKHSIVPTQRRLIDQYKSNFSENRQFIILSAAKREGAHVQALGPICSVLYPCLNVYCYHLSNTYTNELYSNTVRKKKSEIKSQVPTMAYKFGKAPMTTINYIRQSMCLQKLPRKYINRFI